MDEWLLIPDNYELTITIPETPDDASFHGTVQIEGTMKEKANSFALEGCELTAISSEVIQGKNKIKCKCFDDGSGTVLRLNAKPGESVKAGRCIVSISYKGRIRDDGVGLYRADPDGKLLISHFEPQFAPLVFPCLTHPSIRSTIQLTLVHSPTVQAAANAPLLMETLSEDLTMTTSVFQKTSIPIPVYSMGLCLGHWGDRKNHCCVARGSIPIRVLFPDDSFPRAFRAIGDDLSSTLSTFASGVVETLSGYFKVEEDESLVPLDKLDVLLTPKHILAGMENHGLVVIALTAAHLRSLSNAKTKENVMGLLRVSLFHEIAHQWIGNGIGMSLLWKEGIVQVLESIFSGSLIPDLSTLRPLNISPPCLSSSSSHSAETGTRSGKKVGSKSKKRGKKMGLKGPDQSIQGTKDADDGVAKLQNVFSRLMNEDTYKDYSDRMKEFVRKMGGNETFRERLCSLLKRKYGSFVEDEELEKHFSS
eukprot:TRINITY_DN447_c0_g2_i1.p1 TRINITY_DN447_c0_g2~~TRINITY_DN447_c0_g2_i1.p1  ORF type:complete len:478 (-),score=126.39 TRINITY_DN447_c0_g2_i1:108-1541(-)